MYLEGIPTGKNRHERHVNNCDARAKLPHFEIHAAEPILLHRPRLDDKQPKAQLCHMTTQATEVSVQRRTNDWSSPEFRPYLRGG